MPAGMGEEERFAAAVEHGTTPASRGRGDGSGSADQLARELEIVALLRSGGPALGPEPAARDRAKQRMMAAFAQEFGHGDDAGLDPGADEVATGPLQVLAPVALAERAPARQAGPTPLRRSGERAGRSIEGAPRAGRHSAPEVEPELDEPETAPEHDDAPEPAGVRRLRPAAPRRGHGRAAVLGAAAAAALVAIAGTGTFASRDALPGDPMYGVKRVAESTSYALTFGEEAKARRHLEQAQRRLDEVEGMVARSRGASGSTAAVAQPDEELLRSTMQEFDADTSEGSRLLLAGPTPPDTAQVDEVRTWATEQSERLSGLRSTLPAPDQADDSLALLDRVLGETDALVGAACAPTAATADADVCAPGSPLTEPSDTDSPAPTSDGDAERDGTSTPGTDDDEVDGDADTSAEASTEDGPARSSTGGSGRTDDQDRRDGGSGGSGGSGDVSVPLPLPATVELPAVGPLPGVSLGGR